MLQGTGRVEPCWEWDTSSVGTDPVPGFGDSTEGHELSISPWSLRSTSGCSRAAHGGWWVFLGGCRAVSSEISP